MITGEDDGAVSIPGTSRILERGKLKMCISNVRGPIRDTDDVVVLALWFLHTSLEDLQIESPTKRTIKSDGYFHIEEEGAVRLDGPEQVPQFTKLALRDEISSTLGLVFLESGLNYTKLDLYVAFSNSIKYTRPVYVTRSLRCEPDDSFFLIILMVLLSFSIIIFSMFLFRSFGKK